MREGEKLRTWFGPAVGKMWCDTFNKYSNWSKAQLDEFSDRSRRHFREYAQEQLRGDVYEAFSECFWLWHNKKRGEFNAKARETFERFDRRDRSDAEKAILRVLVTLWMRANRHVDDKKVKWD